jgi:hypothetical protein
MIISHASGGALSEPGDIDRSVNDICVEISRHKNEVWKHAQEVARRDRPTDPGEDKVEEVAKAVRRARFERNGKGKAYDPELPLHETELLDASAAIAAMGHTPPSGEDGDLVERLRRKMQRLPAQGGGTISSDGTATSYITDDGMRLVNPDGPAAANRLTALLSHVGVLRETLRLIEIDATNKSSAPGARLQRIADYARSALQGIGGR